MVKIIFFSSKPYVETYFQQVSDKLKLNVTMDFQSTAINNKSVVLAKGYDVVCVFVNDVVSEEVIKTLKDNGCKLLALRCAGYNNVDLKAAKKYDLPVVRVPEYSPFAVAEYAFGMILTLNRKIHKAYNRVRELNFDINGLLGFDLNGKTIGTIGTGKIGQIFIKIAKGFGLNVLAYDPYPNFDVAKKLDYSYVSLEELYAKSDIIALHCPLTKDNYHLINKESLNLMKDGVMIVNTSRGGLINTQDIIAGLKSHKVSGLLMDVYEEEEDLFFEDLSFQSNIADDLLSRLLTFNNVIISSHQAFFTQEALTNIAEVTLDNINSFLEKNTLKNVVN